LKPKNFIIKQEKEMTHKGGRTLEVCPLALSQLQKGNCFSAPQKQTCDDVDGDNPKRAAG